MKGKTRTLIGSGAIALGALVALGPRYLLPVCEYGEKEAAAGGGSMGSMEGMSMEGMSHGGDMTMSGAGSAAAASEHMACYFTARASLVIGIIIGLIGVGFILSKKVSLRRMVAAAMALAGVAVILTPLVLYPTCKSSEMLCNQGAKQLLIVLGGLIVISGGWQVLAPERKTDMIAQTAAESV
jgi:hypothetical protein